MENKNRPKEHHSELLNKLMDEITPEEQERVNKEMLEMADKPPQPEEKKDDIKSRFEKEFATRSDYFNHRVGLFMDMANWIEKQLADLRAERDVWKSACENAVKHADDLAMREGKLTESTRVASETIAQYQLMNNELKAERDKLKEERQLWHDNYDDYVERIDKEKTELEAENERLKGEIDRLEFKLEYGREPKPGETNGRTS